MLMRVQGSSASKSTLKSGRGKIHQEDTRRFPGGVAVKQESTRRPPGIWASVNAGARTLPVLIDFVVASQRANQDVAKRGSASSV
jgi:hypothetical protein